MTSFKVALTSSLVAMQSLCALNVAYGQDLTPATQDQTVSSIPVLRSYAEAVAHLESLPAHTPLGTAWQLKKNSDEANARDLRIIWEGLAELIATQSAEDLYTALQNKVEHDRAAFKAARDCHAAAGTQDTAWSAALGSCIGKILGTDKFSGLLDDLLTQYQATIGQGKVFSGNSADLNPAIPNEVVQFKFLGLYLRSVLEGKTLDEMNFPILSTLYPNYYNNTVCAEPLKTTVLYGKVAQITPQVEGLTPALQMPTMGFTWGANMISYYPQDSTDVINTGNELVLKPLFIGDASAWVSATNRWDAIRIATYFMCLGAQVQEGKKTLESIDQGDASYVKTFLSLVDLVPLDSLKSGDTMVWCPGFTALFLGWADEAKENVWTMAMNRADEKDVEGIDARTRLLHMEKKETKVFRSKIEHQGYLSTIIAKEENGTCLSISAQGNVTYPCVPASYGAESPWPVPARDEL